MTTPPQGQFPNQGPAQPQDQPQGYGPAQGYPPPLSQPPVPLQPNPAPKTSGMAIAGLVLGIVGLVVCLIPLLNVVGGIAAVVGLALAVVALVKAGKVPSARKGLAIAGAVCSGLALIGAILSAAVFTKAVDEAIKAVDDAVASQTALPDEPEAAESSEQQEEPPATGEDSAEYGVTIDSARFTTDYDGNKVIIVTYTFTNNSDDDANFMFAINAKAFQDGVELSDAFVLDDPDYSVEDSLKDIKPGSGLAVQEAYVLSSDAPVSVECSELISLSKDLLATKEFPVQ